MNCQSSKLQMTVKEEPLETLRVTESSNVYSSTATERKLCRCDDEDWRYCPNPSEQVVCFYLTSLRDVLNVSLPSPVEEGTRIQSTRQRTSAAAPVRGGLSQQAELSDSNQTLSQAPRPHWMLRYRSTSAAVALKSLMWKVRKYRHS